MPSDIRGLSFSPTAGVSSSTSVARRQKRRACTLGRSTLLRSRRSSEPSRWAFTRRRTCSSPTASLGYMAASASSTGTLVIGPGVAPTTELRWFDRAGVPFGVAGGPAVDTSPRLSPDQRSVAVSIYDPNAAQRDVWVLDLARGAASRATFDIDGVVSDTGPSGSTRPCVQLDAHWRTSCVSHRS